MKKDKRTPPLFYMPELQATKKSVENNSDKLKRLIDLFNKINIKVEQII